MSGYVLDASAILAFMAGEPGAEKVRAILQAGDAMVSVVNISEVTSKLISRGMASVDAEFQCRSMGLDILPVEEATGFHAASLTVQARHLGLSLGDRICLATASAQNAVAITADKAWGAIQDVEVEVIR